MPTYAFQCSQCEHEFEVDIPWAEKKNVRCPQCESENLKEQFGKYSLNVMGRSGSSAPSCGSPTGGG